MSIRFQWQKNILGTSNPFNGDYLECFDRVPNIGEHVYFSSFKHKVLDVITELRGWEVSYTVVLERGM